MRKPPQVLPLLFRNRCIVDDAGDRRRVTGGLLRTLDLCGFNIGRPDDPPSRKAADWAVGLGGVAIMFATAFTPFVLVDQYGCWLFPPAAILAWLTFHHTRLFVAKSADEYELQQALQAYRDRHTGHCPACDTRLPLVETDGIRICEGCEAVWIDAFPSSP